MHIAKVPKGPPAKESVPKTSTMHGVPVPTARPMKSTPETFRPHPPGARPFPAPGGKAGKKMPVLD